MKTSGFRRGKINGPLYSSWSGPFSGEADSVDRRLALRAASVFQVVFQNGKPVTVEQEKAALMTKRFFSRIPGNIAGIHIAEPGFPADAPGLLQGLNRRHRQMGESKGGVKTADVPGGLRA